MDELSRRRYEKRLRAKLSSEEIRGNFVSAALFLVAWELLRGEIVDKPRNFFAMEFDFEKGGGKPSPEYQAEVLSLDRYPFHASCLWLAKMGAFSEADVQAAQAIREHRNALAHELPSFLIDPKATIDLSLFIEANRLIVALGNFWGRIVVDTDPQFDDVDVRDEDIQSGTMVLMQHILSVVSEAET